MADPEPGQAADIAEILLPTAWILPPAGRQVLAFVALATDPGGKTLLSMPCDNLLGRRRLSFGLVDGQAHGRDGHGPSSEEDDRSWE